MPPKGKASYKATSKSPRKLVRTPTKDTDAVDGAEITLPASPRSASPSPTRSQPDLPEPVEVESQSQIISPVNSPAKRSRRAIESDEEEIDDAASVVVSISETEAMTPPKLPTQRRGSTTAKGTDDAVTVSTPPPSTVRNVRRPLYLARATSDKADNAPKTPTRSETLPRVLPSSSPSMLLAATRLSRARATKAKSSTVRSPAKSSTVRSPAKDLDAIDPRPAGTSSSRGTGKVKKPTASSTPRPRASVTAWLTSSQSTPAASKRALIDDEPEADDPDDDDFVVDDIDDDDEGNDTVVVNPDNIEPSQSQNR